MSKTEYESLTPQKSASDKVPAKSVLEVPPGMERRKFLELVGATMALAGTTTVGCIRRPVEHIYPENHRPENALPGIPQYYSTSAQIGSGVLGLLVTSTDGRPTKIDGNPRHVMNNPIVGSTLGSSNTFAQAEILNLYDPGRGQKCFRSEKEIETKEAYQALQASLLNAKKNAGEQLALIYAESSSPTFISLLEEFKLNYPKAFIAKQDTTYSKNRKYALSQITNKSVDVVYDFLKANVVLAIDSDFLSLESDSVKNTRQFSEKRRIIDAQSSMSRLYSVEANYSITGAAADHRYALRSTSMGDFLLALAQALVDSGLVLPDDVRKKVVRNKEFNKTLQKWISAVAKDLYSQKGESIIIVGDRQPPWIHMLAFAINSALGSIGKTVSLIPAPTYFENQTQLEDIKPLLEKNSIQTLIVIDGNPVYSTPADLNFKELFPKVSQSFYLGYFKDETAKVCQYYFPKTHFLETWGDTRATDGTVSLIQPLISPLFEDCQDEYRFLRALSHSDTVANYDIVKQFWKKNLPNGNEDFETRFRRYLSTGIVSDAQKQLPIDNNFSYSHMTVVNLKDYIIQNPKENVLDIEFTLDRSVYDGRYSHNAWLQEAADPIYKLVWDNALLLNPKTAKALGLNGSPQPGKKDVDLVKITYQGRSIEVAVWEVLGIPDSTAVIQLGYGRKTEGLAKSCGFNANLIRTSDSWFGAGAKIEKTGKTYPLVSTQEHYSMSGKPGDKADRPPVVREATLAQFKTKPEFVLQNELLAPEEQKSNLFKFPKDPAQKKWARQQWGMTIDLNSCIGCNACAIACQSENNISVVGKDEVFKNREMSWIRVDRYFNGKSDDPEVKTVFQPINCQHCENAPCEAVCPVTATSHSPDGLNDMTYNRCVGTRYCANNCPYKVRRFNFFNYSKENDEENPLYAMQKNPNVTVRFRGVMEKCTYCVQRINSAKIQANNNNSDGLVPDGAIITACQSVCPANAIVFGDVANKETAVSKLKAQSRNYSLLGELNTQPRTTYLAKLRNLNPELENGT